MLNSFVQGYRRDAVAAFFGHRKPENEYMRRGSQLHKLLGFDNQEKFSCTFELDGDYVELVGKVDWIDKERRIIKELKTLFSYDGYIPGKKIEAARIQLQSYLLAYRYPMGQLVFVDASKWDGDKSQLPPIVKKIFVYRDDEAVLEVIRKFIKEIKSQSRITVYLNSDIEPD